MAAWIVVQFGRTPHACWRRIWIANQRATGRVVRLAIAGALIAASRLERGSA